jgi:hypothetical protein
VKAAFAKADGGVERGEAAEADVERRDGSAGTEFAVLMFEDGDEGGGCRNLFGAGLLGSRWVERRRRVVVKKSRWWCGRRRKELQKLAQRGGAGMLGCGQGLVLVTATITLLDQTLFRIVFNFYFFGRCAIAGSYQRHRRPRDRRIGLVL